MLYLGIFFSLLQLQNHLHTVHSARRSNCIGGSTDSPLVQSPNGQSRLPSHVHPGNSKVPPRQSSNPPPRSSPSGFPPAQSTSIMLPMARPAVSGALCGKNIPRLSIQKAPCLRLRPFAVRPRLASCLPRASPIAALSTSSVKSATALERQSSSGQALTASGKVRKEVPLPSQEKKEGAMQYVLYVPLPGSRLSPRSVPSC